MQQAQDIFEKDQTIIELEHEVEALRKQLEQSKEAVLDSFEKERAIKQDLTDHQTLINSLKMQLSHINERQFQDEQ